MMNKLKLKSYALLMAYDLHKIIERNSDSLKEYLKEESDPLNEQILQHLKEIGTTPVDIYSWTPDWNKFCRTLNNLVKPSFKTTLIETDSMLNLLKKWYIEAENIDLKTLSNRIVYIITKYINLNWVFHIIHKNYNDFKKYHSDVEIGSERFNEILLKKINKGRTALSSERIHREVENYFSDSKKKETLTYDFILNNIPFDLLTEINTSNDNKISLFFQRGLAKQILFYLNFTKMSITQKQYFIGFSFKLCGYIYNEDAFIQKRLAKDKHYEFAQSDYDEFLRTEGYNICKTL